MADEGMCCIKEMCASVTAGSNVLLLIKDTAVLHLKLASGELRDERGMIVTTK